MNLTIHVKTRRGNIISSQPDQNTEKCCPICDSKNLLPMALLTSVYSRNTHQLWRCEECCHVYDFKKYNPQELAETYQSLYNYGAHAAIAKEKKTRIKHALKLFFPQDRKNLMFMDIGCMHGFSLEAARDLGVDSLHGIEIDTTAVASCRAKGFDIFEGTLEKWLLTANTQPLPNNLIILMSHVMEHIEDVMGELRKLRLKMPAGSSLIILVPNADSHTARFFGKYWGWWQVPIHRHHFSKKSLRFLLQQCGFNVVNMVTRGADSLFWFSSIALFLRMKSASSNISPIPSLIVKLASKLLQYWSCFGDEELVCFAHADANYSMEQET